MSFQSWGEVLARAEVDGTPLANTLTATSILPAQAKVQLPQSAFFYVGKLLRARAVGRVSTTTGPPTITFDVRFGSVIVFNGGAVTTVASVTNKTWWLDVTLTCRAVGAGGSATANMMGTGSLTSSAVVGSTGGAANTALLPDSAPVVGTSFDPGAAAVVDLFATWSAASASNTLQLHQFILEALN